MEKADTAKNAQQGSSATTIQAENSPKTKADTSVIRIGKKRIVYTESGDKTTIEFPASEDDFCLEIRGKRRFSGHWSGFEMGINGFVDKNRSISLADELNWLDLRQTRSWNFNFNFMQYSMGFGSDKVGLVTGMGLEFNNYLFSNPISLQMADGVTSVDSSYIKADYRVGKTKLSTTSLILPLLLEFQIPAEKNNRRIYISAGVIGGVRLGSRTKVVFYDNDGDKRKNKNRNDFNIATFRYGLTARVGYRAIRLYANYYPTQLFEKGKGPEVYPFAIGLVLAPF